MAGPSTAVPVWKLQTPPAKPFLCVHCHSAGRTLSIKNPVSLSYYVPYMYVTIKVLVILWPLHFQWLLVLGHNVEAI